MFGLFRRMPKFTPQEMFEQLGKATDGIVSAAAESSDIAAGLKGAAVVSAIIAESKQFYDLTVKPNTIFARFALAAKEQDIATLAKMTREMASALGQVTDVSNKGALMHFWFNGENQISLANPLAGDG